MQENKKKLGIFLIALGLILIFIIVYLFFIKKDEGSQPGPSEIENPIASPSPQFIEQSGTTTPSDIPREREYDISKEEEHVFNESDLAKRAQAYAERFGSFNNQSDYSNFSDLKIYMTESFSVWVDNYVKELKERNSNPSSYYGIVTDAISTELLSFDKKTAKASVRVTTKRTESDANGEKPQFYQSLRFDFVELNGEWLIDAAYWEKN